VFPVYSPVLALASSRVLTGATPKRLIGLSSNELPELLTRQKSANFRAGGIINDRDRGEAQYFLGRGIPR